ncbi:Beta-galactoside alpha-2,6-sialyltransferase 2 [Bos mutus]|uniref:Beta-galactoside alpha-2,6-sialyltransferase 1 n=1 Tax=Bos mutus TaxID=72004 RepID=L8IZ92_9CETA|nr:Beta-galactoside alpha-2,6-sialyltransferase 2 [Bos mutus]
MKPHLKQWRQGMLCGVFAWGLFFVVIFLYFTDSSPAKPAPSSFSFLETRRLLPAQGRQRAIMGASEGLPEGADLRRGSPRGLPSGPLRTWAADGFEREQEFLSVQTGRTSLSAFAPEDSAPGTSGRLFPGDPGPEGARPPAAPAQAPDLRRGHVGRRHPQLISGRGDRFGREKNCLWQAVPRRLGRGLPLQIPALRKEMTDSMFSSPVSCLIRSSPSKCEWTVQFLRRLSGRGTARQDLPDGLCSSSAHSPSHPGPFCSLTAGGGSVSVPVSLYSHDAVLRFNSAPTRGYEKDVGNKTTVRIINSQILTNPSYHFMDSALYKDVILVAWDPAPYSANLNLWYKKPDYNLFTPYVQHRQRNPNQPFYILHPKFIWQLWDIIQENTKEKIQPNPPSSGFIGILLMMNLCGEVHVYEYVPSVRQTDLCHYHEPYHDAACTLGAYHPLLYEKLLVQRLNVGTHGDLHRKGKVVLPGLQAVRCPPGA